MIFTRWFVVILRNSTRASRNVDHVTILYIVDHNYVYLWSIQHCRDDSEEVGHDTLLRYHHMTLVLYAATSSRMQLLLLANVSVCGLWINLKLR